MQAVGVLTEYTIPKTGTNDNGFWQLHQFKDAGGNKYKTFEDDLANIAKPFVGTGAQVLLTYEESQREYTHNGVQKTTTDKKLTSIEPYTGQAVATPPPAQPAQQAQTTGGGSQAEYRRSKEELRRSEALAHALQLVGVGLMAANSWPELTVAAKIVGDWLETGQLATAATSQPTMDTSPGEPVAFDPQTGAPIY